MASNDPSLLQLPTSMNPAYTIEIQRSSCHLKCGTLILKTTCDLNSIFRTIYNENAIHLQIQDKMKGETTILPKWTTLKVDKITIDPDRIEQLRSKSDSLNAFLSKCQKQWPKVERQIWQKNAKLSASL